MRFLLSASVALLVWAVSAGFVSADEAIHNIREFGATGDGQVLDSPAIQKAIDACAQQGGGTVLFPPGTYLSGTLYLKSHMRLRMERGACLLGTKDLTHYYQPESPEHYVYITSSRHIFLYGDHVEDVTLEGEGVIDGNWATDVDPVTKQERRGPMAVFFQHSKQIKLDTIAVTRSPGWAITFFDCQKVDLLGVKVIHCKCDGINPVCSQDVLYDGVYIDGTGDDAITIKNEGTLDKPHVTRNITIRNTTVKHTGHPAVKIGTGTAGTFENILVENCRFENVGSCFTIQLMRPAMPQNPERFIKNVVLRNVAVKGGWSLVDITTIGVATPVIRDLRLENIEYSGHVAGSRINGLERAPIENVVLKNVKVDAQTPGATFLHTGYVRNLTLENVELAGQPIDTFLVAEQGDRVVVQNARASSLTSAAPALRIADIKDVTLSEVHVNSTSPLLSIAGSRVERLTLESSLYEELAVPLVVEDDVPEAALESLAAKGGTVELTSPAQVRAGQAFAVKVGLRSETAGPRKVRLMSGEQCLAERWTWLKPEAAVSLEVPCRPIYRPGQAELRVGTQTKTIAIEPTPADLRYGELCEVEMPAAEKATASFLVPLSNLGGTAGQATVELKRDGRVVASQSVTLEPGQTRQVHLEATVPDRQTHRWQVGDFPEWAYATFRNVPGKVSLGRDRIRIEAAGRHNHPEDMVALFVPQVEGDFDATVVCVSQSEWTGDNAAIGMILSNELGRPTAGGLSQHFRVPRYGGYKIWVADRDGDGTPEARFDIGHVQFPLWLKYEKRGQTLRTYTSADGQNWLSGGSIDVPSAAAVQDVGIYANAWNADGDCAVAEFRHFTLTPLGRK